MPAAAQWEVRTAPWRATPFTGFLAAAFEALDTDAPPARILFSVGEVDGASGLFRSNDEALTWRPVPIPGYANPAVLWIGTLPSAIGTSSRRGDLYVTVRVGGYYLGYDRCDLLRTRDAGATWTAVSRNTDICTIVIDPSSTNTFYGLAVGYFSSFGTALYRSRDSGITWQLLDTQPVHSVIRAVRAAADGTLYALADSVRVSHDDGATWSSSTNWPMRGPVPSVSPFDLVTFRHPVHGDRFALAATTNGLYRTIDAGVTWQPAGLQDFSIRYLALADRAQDGEPLVLVGYSGGLALLRGETLSSLTNGLPADGNAVPKAGRYAATTAGIAVCKDLAGCAGGTLPHTATLIEYHQAALDHYFLTLEGPEAEGIDRGAAGPGWVRTGETFTVYPDGKAALGQPVCRFYGTLRVGPNSHFYTVETLECDNVRRDPGWMLESAGAFFAVMPEWRVRTPTQTAVERYCPTGLTIYRLYNNRFAQNDSNHRYVKDLALYPSMASRGWTGEGAALCVIR